MKNWTKEEISLQEEKEQNIQEFGNAIGFLDKENTSLLSGDITKGIYKKLVTLIANLLASDEYLLAILASNISDFKFYCKKLEDYRKAGNVEAYIAIQKVKTSTSNSILTQLKSLGLTSDSRNKIHLIFEDSEEDS